jgi:hypothetical protein
VADLFGATGVTRELVYLFCGPLALAFFFNGVIFVSNAAFNNLGHPFHSTWINWGRHTLGTIPLVILGAAMFGAPGVLIGQAAGGLVFAVIAFFLVRRVMARTEGEGAAPPEPFAREARLSSFFITAGRAGQRWGHLGTTLTDSAVSQSSTSPCSACDRGW